ncbi:unnamed protein product, partial [Echinostoma caproni]|uniref:Enoyl-CoA hydratase n=1 Tax=Echinostoma caproni TaxID=27848 RepID=A0A183B762_9TREM
ILTDLSHPVLQTDHNVFFPHIPFAKSAGADIKEMCGKTYPFAFRRNFLAEWERIACTRKPLIAAVCGFALGGGCELAMMCDIIYASETAKFGQPEIKLGIIPGGGGTQRLIRAIGKSRAMEWILTGDMFSAQEAAAAGLVSRLFPPDQVVPKALELGEKIAGFSGLTTLTAKEAVNSGKLGSVLHTICFVPETKMMCYSLLFRLVVCLNAFLPVNK